MGGLNSRWVEHVGFFYSPSEFFIDDLTSTSMYVINSNVLSMDVKYINQKLNIL